jgi:hypothetical protein
MARELTERQKLFLDVLFTDECAGDPRIAMSLAGYSDNVAPSSVTASLKDEILERTKVWLANQGPKAAMKMVGILNSPTQLGNRELLQASKEILDRIGVIKTEVVQVQGEGGIMILPAKRDAEEQAE